MLIPLRNMTAIYLRRGDRYLLLHREGSRQIDGLWVGAAGGHFEPEELNDPTTCILRELTEETGLTARDIENLTMRYVTLRYTGGEIRQNYYFFADLTAQPDALSSNEGTLAWMTLDEALEHEMPVTAKYVVAHYRAVGQYDDALYGGITTDDGMDFVKMG